jgi:hypothetical protein
MKNVRTNPGGQLDPDEIVGRDELIQRLWEVLEGRCVYMNDLRRIGKTQIMVKMNAEPARGWVCVKRDLGRFHTADEFARSAYEDSASVVTGGKKAMRKMSELVAITGGMEVAGMIKLPDGSLPPWKEILQRTFEDISQCVAKKSQRMLFLWDEVPFLIDNIAKRQGEQVAMEVLDSIRSFTQDFDQIRVLLTGSIGLHHVLKSLQQKGYSGSPLNRMELVRPGPLGPNEAVQLATDLLNGESICTDDDQRCAEFIAHSVGNVPFYIHKLISRLSKSKSYTVEALNVVLNSELADLNNDWDLDHYRVRIGDYYGGDESLALAILDSIAIHQKLPFDEVRSLVSSQIKASAETLRLVLKMLCKDHYLEHSPDGTYRFYIAVVARWWQISRDLKPRG